MTCIGFGPDEGRPNGGINFDETYLIPEIKTPGFFTKLPSEGPRVPELARVQSHHQATRCIACGGTSTSPTTSGSEMTHFNDFHAIHDRGGHRSPFTPRDLLLDAHLPLRVKKLLYLASHTHKRGSSSGVNGPDGARASTRARSTAIPSFLPFDPPMVFDSPDAAARTLTYCATCITTVSATTARPTPGDRHPPLEEARAEHLRAGRLRRRAGRRALWEPTTMRLPRPRRARATGAATPCPISGGPTTDDEMFCPPRRQPADRRRRPDRPRNPCGCPTPRVSGAGAAWRARSTGHSGVPAARSRCPESHRSFRRGATGRARTQASPRGSASRSRRGDRRLCRAAPSGAPEKARRRGVPPRRRRARSRPGTAATLEPRAGAAADLARGHRGGGRRRGLIAAAPRPGAAPARCRRGTFGLRRRARSRLDPLRRKRRRARAGRAASRAHFADAADRAARWSSSSASENARRQRCVRR